MPKKLSKALTPLQVKNAKPGRHADGDGLHLLVKQTGASSWVYRFMLDGRARDVGLSRCPEAIELLRRSGGEELTLAQARDVAAIYRMKVKAGIEPLMERDVDLADVHMNMSSAQSAAPRLSGTAAMAIPSKGGGAAAHRWAARPTRRARPCARPPCRW